MNYHGNVTAQTSQDLSHDFYKHRKCRIFLFTSCCPFTHLNFLWLINFLDREIKSIFLQRKKLFYFCQNYRFAFLGHPRQPTVTNGQIKTMKKVNIQSENISQLSFWMFFITLLWGMQLFLQKPPLHTAEPTTSHPSIFSCLSCRPGSAPPAGPAAAIQTAGEDAGARPRQAQLGHFHPLKLLAI